MINPQKPYHSFNPSAVWYFARMPLKISCQIYPSTMPPIRFGIKKMVRKIFVPFIFCVSAIASANAKTLITIRDTAANRQVYQNECRNTVSLSASI